MGAIVSAERVGGSCAEEAYFESARTCRDLGGGCIFDGDGGLRRRYQASCSRTGPRPQRRTRRRVRHPRAMRLRRPLLLRLIPRRRAAPPTQPPLRRVPQLAPCAIVVINRRRLAAALPKPNSGAAKGNAAMAADEDSEQPNFTPMPALDGNPGLFTLETGETLPKHGWSLGVGLNKFSRMPGDITSLQLVPSFGYGVNRWFSIFFQINSYDYIHVGEPSLLSLASVNAANPQYQNTIYNSIIPSTGFPPAYVEDAPFASHNGSGAGEMDLGFKIGLLSERRGKPISLSIRNDFYFLRRPGWRTCCRTRCSTEDSIMELGWRPARRSFTAELRRRRTGRIVSRAIPAIRRSSAACPRPWC